MHMLGICTLFPYHMAKLSLQLMPNNFRMISPTSGVLTTLRRLWNSGYLKHFKNPREVPELLMDPYQTILIQQILGSSGQAQLI